MDEDTGRAFEAVLAQMNDGFERIIDRLEALERAFTNTKGFLVAELERKSPPL